MLSIIHIFRNQFFKNLNIFRNNNANCSVQVWTWVREFISSDSNHYTTNASRQKYVNYRKYLILNLKKIFLLFLDSISFIPF